MEGGCGVMGVEESLNNNKTILEKCRVFANLVAKK
jgi:hypothetical protein